NGRRRRHVVVEAAVLVEADQENAAFPVRRVADRLVDVFDKPFAAGDVVEWVHGVAAREVAWAGDVEAVCAIAWLDEHEPGSEVDVLQLRAEVLEVGESTLQRVEVHAA